jgi:alpha-L-fucosidase
VASISALASEPPPSAPTSQPPTLADTKLAVPTRDQFLWHELEVGMFIHLAPQTWQDREEDDLSTPASAINPEKLDTEQWATVAASMGAKYIVFVAKHEGGFCWWPTATTDYSVKSSPWRDGKGDVLADLAASCKKHNLKLGVYLSPQDKKHSVGVGGKAKDPAKQAEYEKLFRSQLTEVLSHYGTMVEVWFDGSLIFDVGDILKEHAPHAAIFQGPQATIRWVGNEDGIAPDPAWTAVNSKAKKWGDYTAADGDPNGDAWLPNECDARIRATWFWKTNNENTLKSVDQLMDMYEKSVGRGGNLLLNNTPDRSGLIPEADAKRSAEFGAAIKRRYQTAAIETSGHGKDISSQPVSTVTIDRIMLQEDIQRGQRVRKYTVEGLRDAKWTTLSTGTSIGHKKIDAIAPTKIDAVRVRIEDSVGEAMISRLAVFRAPAP